MIIEITRRYELIAGHYLPNVPPAHKCKRPHGHNYEVEVSLQGPFSETYGWVMDYWDLDKIIDPILAKLDHRMLNEIEGLENPTAEVIAAWFYAKLEKELPAMPERIHISKVRVFETSTCIATVINDGKPWSTL